MSGEHPQVRWGRDGNWAFFRGRPGADTIPAGCYNVEEAQSWGTYLYKTPVAPVTAERIVPLPNSSAERIVAEIEHFWTVAGEFHRRGLVHRRGVLMYGPPGSGKTTVSRAIASRVISEHNGVVINGLCSPRLLMNALSMLLEYEPGRRIVVVLEDLDTLIQKYNDEGTYLEVLDGHLRTDGVVFLATTNFPEALKDRFTNRPSRFDLVVEVGMPEPAARRAYIQAREPDMDESTLASWIEATEGFGIAHIQELIVACLCLGRPLEEVAARMRSMQQNAPTVEPDFRRQVRAFNEGQPLTLNRKRNEA